MSSDESCSSSRAIGPTHSVVLSPWVNERFPAWEQLLSAHDVARLTRRPRWVLYSMMVLGRFPRKRLYHGHGIGWLRTDVVHWLAKDLRAEQCRTGAGPASDRRPITQASLPLEFSAPCRARKNGGCRSTNAHGHGQGSQ
jgi:predicted DNA-binding transcriptional regulator AlpA